jgi:Fe-S cluster assembly scaffold protein SufB
MGEIVIKENEERILPILWMGEETQMSYDIVLAGNGAKITLLALLLGRNLNKLDLKTNIYHQKPNTQSRIIVKGALSDSANINFDGLVKIEPGAHGTNAWLAAHILLLSKQARGRAVPSLEILENDIKAGHATTVGRVNDLELFYLMSRGLSEKDSKSLIVQGFLNSMLEEFPTELANKVKREIEFQ